MMTIDYDRDKVAKMLNTTHGFSIPASDGKVYRTVVNSPPFSRPGDREVYEQARQEWMESGDSKGEMWDQAMRHHTKLVLDDMRAFAAHPKTYARRDKVWSNAEGFIDAYEKDMKK